MAFHDVSQRNELKKSVVPARPWALAFSAIIGCGYPFSSRSNIAIS